MTRAFIVAVLIAVTCGLATAAGLPSQEGLPPELVIAPTPPLAQQLTALQGLRAWSEANRPRGGGFLNSIASFFSKSSKPGPVQAQALVQSPELFRGKLVEVSGVYQPLSAEIAKFHAEGGRSIRISLPQGIQVQGITAATPAGLPVTVQGIVETAGDVPQIRASLIKPSDWLTLLRMARIYELTDQSEAAQQTYEKASAAAHQTAFAGFAKASAGRIAYDRRQVKQARNLLSTAWTSFAGKDKQGRPKAYTWVPLADGSGWEKLPLTKAIAEPLDALSRTDFWYQFMEFFVNLAGGSRWLGIVFLSVISRVVIWPLTKKQLASAESMKRLQPQIKALQERFVEDKQKFQEEFWKLCQANGVNPLGGCLPMIIQFPVLILLYKGIREYIVQFQGHSFLWVRDLGAPDYGLLIAYTISMVFFQKMTQKLQPTPTMNPQQAQQQQMMTYMMPAMFFFFFQNFPAAFLLYWLSTNVVYFVQQYAYTQSMNRKAAAGETESLAPPTKPGGFTGAMARMMSLRGKIETPETPSPEARSFHEKQAETKGKKVSKPADKSGTKGK